LDALAAPVFLVDDDDAVRDSIRALLESYGLEVHDYPSGHAFLADPAVGDRGCLILDMHMPGMTGLEVLGFMRCSARRMPVIAITGRVDERLIERLRTAGACAVFEKPVDESVLLNAIERAVAH
jgi:two-component system CheB/CheR fusion protein